MKNLFKLSLLLMTALCYNSDVWSQCPVIPATITPTANPAEYEIEFDFTGVAVPSDYGCYVSFHNSLSGQTVWSPTITIIDNPVLFTIPINGYFDTYAGTYAINPPYCSDSMSLGILSISNYPTDCDASITSANITSNEFTFFANIAYGGISTTPIYSWDFGDGTTGTGNPANHIYPIGLMTNYDVTLTVTDIYCADDATTTISAGTYSSCITYMYNVVDSSSAPGSWFVVGGSFGTGANILWDFGDGTTSNLNPVHHTFVSTGGVNLFEVVCIVDDLSCQDTASITAYSGPNSQCEALFTLEADTMNPGDYNGFNFSTTNGITSYFWDFGDGGTSTDPYPTHTYTSIGVFDVCLTITTDNSCIDTLCLPIDVLMKSGTTINIMDPAQSLSIVNHSTTPEITIYPNPTDGNFSITFQSAKQEFYKILLQDVTGKIIYTDEYNVAEGFNKIQVSLENFASGIYFLNMNGTIVSKLIVE